MATAFSLISLVVCIHHTSASTPQPNTTSFSSPSKSPLSSTMPSLSSSSSPLATTVNSTPGISRSTISPMMSASTFSNYSQTSNISSTQSPTILATSVRPSSNPTSLAIIESYSMDSSTSLYRENQNSSDSFEMSNIYIMTTEEIWLSTLDPFTPTSALPSSTSYPSNGSLFPFPTPPPPPVSPSPSPSSSSAAMSGAGERTTPRYPHLSSSSYKYDQVLTTVVDNSTSAFTSTSAISTTSHALNGSTPMSPPQSTFHAPEITSTIIYPNVTSVVETHTVLMTASVDGNMSATSIAPSVQSTQMLFSDDVNITATSIYPTPFPTTIPLASSSVPLNASRSEVSSVMPSTPMISTSTAATVSQSPLPEITPTNATLDDDTTLPNEYVTVNCTMVLGGDCQPVLARLDAFKKNFTKSISSLISLDPWRISVNDVKCGSIVVDFTIEDTTEGDFAEDLSGFIDTGKISVPFDNQNMIAEKIIIRNGPFADATSTSSGGVGPSDSPPVSDGDGGGLTFEQQQKLIYILIGVVVGFVVLLAIVLVVHHVMRKTCSKSTQSFDLQDEPCIKLTDFNMAHTCIPRPRSIYSSIGADGRFFRYDNQEDVGNPPASPTSFMYADSHDIKEHYHEVIDPDAHDTLTSSMENQRDFGRSGLPEWNLPLIDGAPPVSQDLLTTIDSHHSSQPSTSSDTFRPPSTASSTLNNPPVFSPPAPPPPPPPPLPTPIIQSGTLRSRQSCDASSEMTDSSGDTNTLTKGSSDVGTSMMGIDNPLMTPEEDYDIPGPSTSGRMAKYVVR